MSAPRAFYNEIDPDAAFVLRCLIAEGLIADGHVSETSIKDLQPDDLEGYTQVHLFAGAGLWSVAARLAGWPDDRPIWSASCPCQPFSAAGKGLGVDDPRHLWPDVDRLVRGARERGFGPAVLVGEQVAGTPGYHWFNGVRADLAQQGYRAGVVDIPACAVDAPHIRQRLYWCAVGEPAGSGRVEGLSGPKAARYGREPAAADQREHGAVADAGCGGDESRLRSGKASGAARPDEGEARERQRGRDDDRLHAGRLSLADADTGGCAGRQEAPQWGKVGRTADERLAGRVLEHATGERRGEGRAEPAVRSGRPAVADANLLGVTLGDAERAGLEGQCRDVGYRNGPGWLDQNTARPASSPDGRNGSAWADHEWIGCHDGKARRTEPGLRLLVDGMAGRIPAWRLGGNSIVAPLAAEVIASLMDVLDDRSAA